MNRSVHTAASEEGCICGVDYCVYLLLRDVAFNDADFFVHLLRLCFTSEGQCLRNVRALPDRGTLKLETVQTGTTDDKWTQSCPRTGGALRAATSIRRSSDALCASQIANRFSKVIL